MPQGFDRYKHAGVTTEELEFQKAQGELTFVPNAKQLSDAVYLNSSAGKYQSRISMQSSKRSI